MVWTLLFALKASAPLQGSVGVPVPALGSSLDLLQSWGSLGFGAGLVRVDPKVGPSPRRGPGGRARVSSWLLCPAPPRKGAGGAEEGAPAATDC